MKNYLIITRGYKSSFCLPIPQSSGIFIKTATKLPQADPNKKEAEA